MSTYVNTGGDSSNKERGNKKCAPFMVKSPLKHKKHFLLKKFKIYPLTL